MTIIEPDVPRDAHGTARCEDHPDVDTVKLSHAVGRECPTCHAVVCVRCGHKAAEAWMGGYCEGRRDGDPIGGCYRIVQDVAERYAAEHDLRWKKAAGWDEACDHLARTSPQHAELLRAANPYRD